MKLIRPTNRYKYNEQEELADVVNDLNDNDITIDVASMDKLKRSVVSCTKSHAATYPCEYCESPAKTFKDQTMKKSQLTWPPSTMNGRPRTITGIKRIVRSIEESDRPLSKHYVKGIKGRSVFLNQPNFDYIIDLPTEYMHSLCIGLLGRLVELTYNVGKKRKRVTRRKRTNPKLFNELISTIQVLREFSRRCRNLDPSVLKAQEYRNLLIFFFPIVIKNIKETFKKERQLWLSLAFAIRACVIPNEEFEKVNKESIVKSCELFYNLFYEVYGQKNCTYSLHVIASHLMKIRGNVPLTERSAFPFESFYSEMKNLFKPGTSAPLKQILQNTIMKRLLEYHTCKKSIYYSEVSEKETMENNSMIYTVNNGKYEFYIITKIDGNEFTCKKQGKFEYKTPILPSLKWSTVGVYRKGPTGTELFSINRNEIRGKLISVLDMIITCPFNVLNEK